MIVGRSAWQNTPDRLRASVLLVLFAALVLVRLPQVVLHGRFYAEEATNFFAYAWHMPWQEALFRSFGGYLNLVASAATLVAARLVQHGVIPLGMAPYVTMATALLFQMLPAVLIVTSRDNWLRPLWVKPLALLLVATVPATDEVWLHTLHSQFHLTVCVAFIAALDVPASRSARAFRLALLLLAPLSGMGAVVLLPVLGLRALFDRNAARWVQFAAMAVASFLQLFVFYAPAEVRSFRFDLFELGGNIVTRHVALPFGTPLIAQMVGESLLPSNSALVRSAIILVLFAGFFGPLVFLCLRRWGQPPFWLLLCAVTVGLATYIGAIAKQYTLLNPFAGERYTFVPQVLIDLCIIALVVGGTPRLVKAGRIVLGLLVFVSLGSLPFGPRPIVRGPDWKTQAALWEADPTHQLLAWPGAWTTDLNPRSPGCAVADIAKAASWCDAAWLYRMQVEMLGMKPRVGRVLASNPELGKAAARCEAGATGTRLLVHVAGLKDRLGNLKLEVYPGTQDGFLDDDDALLVEGKVFRRVEQPISETRNDTLCVRLPGPGTYTMVVLHDRNADHKFNFASEGIGFSANPKIGLGLPKARDVTLRVASSGVSQTGVVLNYRTGLLRFSPLGAR